MVNETVQAAVETTTAITSSLTWPQAIFYAAIAICACLIAFFFLYYNDKRHKRNPTQPTNPFLICFVVMLLATGIMLMLYVVDIIDKVFFEKWWWLIPALGILILLYYYILMRKLKPMKLHKQLQVSDELLYEIYKVEPFRGEVNYLPMDGYVTTQTTGRENVGNLLLMRKGHTGNKFLVQLDKLTGEFLSIIPNPPENLLRELMKKPFAPYKDVVAEQFGVVQQVEAGTDYEKSGKEETVKD